MKIDSCSRIFSWPTYSSRPRGRSARSMTSSCTPATLAPTTRLSSSFSIMGPFYGSGLGQQLQRLADAVAHGQAVRQVLYRRDGLLVAVAQGQQGVQDIA